MRPIDKKREYLLSVYEELISEPTNDGLYEIIKDHLREHPELTDVFIEKFEMETNKIYRKILAIIVLTGARHEGAIEFLRKEAGWIDFSDFPWNEN